ncbi:hypothetical protein [Streptomyces sp. NPDC047042]|uniref:hypothetical protein n=1 Tax=Streptomyces sp. NPDC047042 TaxID=3154807 RepID=UPI0033E45AAF
MSYDGALRRTYAKLLCAAGPAAALGWTAARGCAATSGSGTGPNALALTAGTLTLALAFLALARLLKISELRLLPGLK